MLYGAAASWNNAYMNMHQGSKDASLYKHIYHMLHAMLLGMLGKEEKDDEFDFIEAAEEKIEEEDEKIIFRPEGAFDEHMEPVDDGLGHIPAKEDDTGTSF
jgi:hypothetical protein